MDGPKRRVAAKEANKRAAQEVSEGHYTKQRNKGGDKEEGAAAKLHNDSKRCTIQKTSVQNGKCRHGNHTGPNRHRGHARNDNGGQIRQGAMQTNNIPRQNPAHTVQQRSEPERKAVHRPRCARRTTGPQPTHDNPPTPPPPSATHNQVH